MKNALKKFPWFEVMLIVGLAVALIVKPQTTVMSATSDTTTATSTATTATATASTTAAALPR